MLRAIRESSKTGFSPEEIIAKQKRREPHVNTALTLNKRTTLPRTRNDASFSQFGISYNARKAPTVDRNSNNNVRSWSDSDTRVALSNFPGMQPSHHPVFVTHQSRQPVAVNSRQRSDSNSSTSSIGLFKSYADVDSGSLREKVIQMKEELKNYERRKKEAEQQKLEAKKRIQGARTVFSERHIKLTEASEKLEKVQDKLDKAEHRLLDVRSRTSESILQQERLVKEQRGEEREIKNVQYEILEAKSARDLTLQRLMEVSHRISAKQQALERTESHIRKRQNHIKALEDIVSSIRVQIRNYEVIRAKKLAKSGDQINRVHLLENFIKQSEERRRIAESKILPLKMYMSQLQDAVQDMRERISKAKSQLKNYTQRLKYQRRYYN